MTTICIRDGVVAFDTQVTSGDALVCRTLKAKKIGDFIVGGTGSPMVLRRFWRYFSERASDAPIWEKDPAFPEIKKGEDSTVFLIEADGSVIEIYEGGFLDEISAPFLAYGTGRDFALGAMAKGASAMDAAKIAASFDAFSSVPILTLDFQNSKAKKWFKKEPEK